MDNIKVMHTSIIIPNYKLGYNAQLEKMLSVWNETYHRLDPKGYYHDEKNNTLLVPRGIDLSYLERVFNTNIEIDYKPDEYEIASYRLKKEPRDNAQKKIISYLLGEGDFAYTKKYSQLCLESATDSGKTYCTVAALTFMKTKSIIITHIDKIKQQWYNTFLKMTDIDEKFICNINGSNIINKLVEKDDWKFKVYLVNHQTIQSYAKKHGWESITELFKKLKVGVKIYDEAHLEFENIIKTDLFTNTKKTIYLTATFERSNYKENKLFNLCFKNIAKYGLGIKKEKRKHTVYIGLLFDTKPNLDIQASMIGIHGFDKNKYIDYEIKQQKFFDVLSYIIDYFKDKEGKTFILSSKIDSANIIYEYLKNIYEDKSITIYHSKVTDEEKLKIDSSDIISTTPKSAGTGIDIPGLRFEIMTEPYSSHVTANQISGRLREYGPEEYTFYIELIDKGIRKVYDMYKKRLKVFKEKCIKVLELEYERSNI
jgi:superfamily II DNA or RNA helicase